MPAKKKPAKHRKTHTIQVRVTADQLALLQHAAGAAHLELSTWIRYLALKDAEERFDTSKFGRSK